MNLSPELVGGMFVFLCGIIGALILWVRQMYDSRHKTQKEDTDAKYNSLSAKVDRLVTALEKMSDAADKKQESYRIITDNHATRITKLEVFCRTKCGFERREI